MDENRICGLGVHLFDASENIYDLGTKSLTLNQSFFFVDSELE